MSPNTTGFHGTSDVEVGQDAPDVLIAGLNVIRSIVQHSGDNEPQNSWQLTGRVVPASEGRHYLQILGDLLVVEAGWMVGVTASVILDFRNDLAPKRWTTTAVDRMTRTYGPWVSHVLYDTAAAMARSLSVMTLGPRPTITVETPAPLVLTSRDRKAVARRASGSSAARTAR